MPSKKEKIFDKVALKVNGKVFDRALGTLEFGYVILDRATADQWLNKFSDKITEVTPEEVAAVYGK
jgi:hypothetical protein